MQNNLLSWAERWHWPQLSLGQRSAIRAGQQSWEAFTESADAVRMIQALDRIAIWNERAGVEQEQPVQVLAEEMSL